MFIAPEIAADVFRAVLSRDYRNGMLVLRMILRSEGTGRALVGRMYPTLVKRVLEIDGGRFDCYKIKEMADGENLMYVVDANNKTKMTLEAVLQALPRDEDAFNEIVKHNESRSSEVR